MKELVKKIPTKETEQEWLGRVEGKPKEICYLINPERDSRNEQFVVSYALCSSERSNMIRTGMCLLAVRKLLILAQLVLGEECGQKSD